MEKHMAVCPYCGAGCKMNLMVENGRVIDAEGLPGVTNEGELCLKGLYGYDFVNDTRILTPRIYHPMIRRTKGAPLERVSWDEALDFTASRLRAIIEDALMGTMFDLPSRSDVAKVVVTPEVISEGKEPTLVPGEPKRKLPTGKTRREGDSAAANRRPSVS